MRKFTLIVAIFILIVGLGVGILLIDKPQFFKPQAEVSKGQVTDKCGHVTLGPPTENYNAQTSTYTLTIPIKNNRSYSLNKVKIRWETFYCTNGNLQNCDQNRQTFEEEISLSSKQQKVLQKSVKQELGDDCGSLQIDLGILSINNDTSCRTIGEWKDAIWGVHNTGKDCSTPTSPPGQHPGCTQLPGPSSGTPGDILTFTAYPTGTNLDRVEFWLISEEDVNKHGLCPPSEWAPKVWTLIDKDIDGSNGWSASWNTTAYALGKYFIAVNIYSLYGDENWWCTGNPEGPCNNDLKGTSCPNCAKWVTLIKQQPTSTPTLTPIPPTPVPPTTTPVPTITLTPTPIITPTPTVCPLPGQVEGVEIICL